MADQKEKFRIVHTYLEDSESLFAEGFEEAVIDIVERFNSGPWSSMIDPNAFRYSWTEMV